MEKTAVTIRVGSDEFAGDLEIPDDAKAVVLFARGSGPVRGDSRERVVADRLHQVGLGTLRFDLIADYETAPRGNVPDVPVLADRLEQATVWLRDREGARATPVGYFGEGVGSAAALWAAADRDVHIGAVVSLSGEPDAAVDRLGDVAAPVLLLVGDRDEDLLDRNRGAKQLLGGAGKLTVIPNAGHPFEEAGSLGYAAKLAADWFQRYLMPKRR
jgi:pimeloyl-ACP methyl ester carboxylesterase